MCEWVGRIEENYEVREGSCLPRSGLYDNFVDYCADRGIIPMSPPMLVYLFFQLSTKCIV